METNNKNKKIEELTDEQLKQVAGGRRTCLSLDFPHCKTFSIETCECQECSNGYVFWTSPSDVKICVPD